MREVTNNNALVIKTIEGKSSLVASAIKTPTPNSNQALIRVSHVAQNAIDVDSLDSGEYSDGSVLGCDFVGTVEKVGSHVSLLKEGDDVGGIVIGGELIGLGGYSKYTLADERLCFKIPSSIARDEAVTAPLAACMAYLGLFSTSNLNIDIKRLSGNSVLVWGGSSCVGRFAIQIAAMYKLRIIATCAPSNFGLLKSLGAHYVLDYRDKNILAQIQKLAPDLQYAFDTIGASSYSATISRALAGATRNLCSIRLAAEYHFGVIPGITVSEVSVWKAFLNDHHIAGIPRFPSVEDHELAAELFRALPHWLKDGVLRPNHPRVLPGGLYAVQQGFEMDRTDGPLDCKLVYEI